jgi:ribonuclease BN (tRNA processing enzyme)
MLAFNHLIPTDDPNFTTEHWQQEVEPKWKGQFFLGTDGMRIDLN